MSLSQRQECRVGGGVCWVDPQKRKTQHKKTKKAPLLFRVLKKKKHPHHLASVCRLLCLFGLTARRLYQHGTPLTLLCGGKKSTLRRDPLSLSLSLSLSLLFPKGRASKSDDDALDDFDQKRKANREREIFFFPIIIIIIIIVWGCDLRRNDFSRFILSAT